jgi:SAM-dependent methyltransferase
LSTPQEWDEAAGTFDEAPDHGLRDPEIRAAWSGLLLEHLPPAPSTILDLGCGTGTLSVLLAELGYLVTALDSSLGMLQQAAAKARRAEVDVDFQLGDVVAPPVEGTFDVLLCRHVLWSLPSPAEVLAQWRSMLRPGGRLILVEGLWSTGAGLTASDLRPMVELAVGETTLIRLTDPALWGGAIDDERYLLRATEKGDAR